MKLRTKFEVSSPSSFEDMSNRIPKILMVTWPRPRPIWGKLFERPLDFSKKKLSAKFEDSIGSNFEDMFDCMLKSLGVTWPRLRPFWRKLFERPLGFPQTKRCTKFYVSSSSSFEDRFDSMPKMLGSRDLGLAPFVENYLSARSAFHKWSCVPNLKSLAQVGLKWRYVQSYSENFRGHVT